MMKSRFAGYHRIRFDEKLHSKHRWDLAWDLDKWLKSADRPNVPRLLPSIRLNKNGHPACTDVFVSKTIATFFKEEVGEIVVASYKPSEGYLLEVHGFGRFSNELGRSKGCDHFQKLNGLLDNFGSFVQPKQANWLNPMDFAKLIEPQAGRVITIPEEYSGTSYGNWA